LNNSRSHRSTIRISSLIWIRYCTLVVVLAAALVAPAAAATSDAWITTRIKLALLTTEGVSGTAISVDTVLGRVTLYGKVHSDEEKAKAETIARKVDGVQSVRDLLQVVAPQHEKAMQISDDALSYGSNRRCGLIPHSGAVILLCSR
jgi:BON domain